MKCPLCYAIFLLMQLTYATTYNAQDVSKWSGTPYFMTRAFEQNGVALSYIGPLSRPHSSLNQFIKKLTFRSRTSTRFDPKIAQNYSQQVAKALSETQAIIAPQVNPIAYLNCKQPIVLWTDALFAGQVGFHRPSSTLSAQSIRQGNLVTLECLKRSRLAIFSSEWAARTALEVYGIEKEKVHVVPFGANIECNHGLPEVQERINQRPRGIIKLLFIGVEWEGKGADTVLAVAKLLHANGHPVELTMVGCKPPHTVTIPLYVHCLGFISKCTPEGRAQLSTLLWQAHFLFVPSHAEAYGIVFCEANAYAVPCLTTYVGGISTVVNNNINGMTFSLQASPDVYANYIVNLMSDDAAYEALALSAFHEYKTRLNWGVATRRVVALIQGVL